MPWEDLLMTVDDNLAGLMAQVFPTILLALMLEGRIAYRRLSGYRWTRALARLLRGAAVFVSALATFMCLFFLGYDGAQNVWLNLVVTLATLLVFLALVVVAVHVLSAQDSEDFLNEASDPAVNRTLNEIAARLGRNS